jgi:hypothetical protein
VIPHQKIGKNQFVAIVFNKLMSLNLKRIQRDFLVEEEWFPRKELAKSERWEWDHLMRTEQRAWNYLCEDIYDTVSYVTYLSLRNRSVVRENRESQLLEIRRIISDTINLAQSSKERIDRWRQEELDVMLKTMKQEEGIVRATMHDRRVKNLLVQERLNNLNPREPGDDLNALNSEEIQLGADDGNLIDEYIKSESEKTYKLDNRIQTQIGWKSDMWRNFLYGLIAVDAEWCSGLGRQGDLLNSVDDKSEDDETMATKYTRAPKKTRQKRFSVIQLVESPEDIKYEWGNNVVLQQYELWKKTVNRCFLCDGVDEIGKQFVKQQIEMDFTLLNKKYKEAEVIHPHIMWIGMRLEQNGGKLSIIQWKPAKDGKNAQQVKNYQMPEFGRWGRHFIDQYAFKATIKAIGMQAIWETRKLIGEFASFCTKTLSTETIEIGENYERLVRENRETLLQAMQTLDERINKLEPVLETVMRTKLRKEQEEKALLAIRARIGVSVLKRDDILSEFGEWKELALRARVEMSFGGEEATEEDTETETNLHTKLMKERKIFDDRNEDIVSMLKRFDEEEREQLRIAREKEADEENRMREINERVWRPGYEHV